MRCKNLLNQLELAHSPMTAYEFALMKNDVGLEVSLKHSSLYIIAQRPVITIENLVFKSSEFELHFEIHQKENPNILKCKLPLTQETFDLEKEQTVAIAFNFIYSNQKSAEEPVNNLRGFSLLKHRVPKDEFICWFSPEKLLRNWWQHDIECEIDGDVRSFTRYKVHYVGKATKQSIIKRLTGHSTFQDILSLEMPVTEKQLPANEIVILPFMFHNTLELQSFGAEQDVNSMVDALTMKNFPSEESVFLDAEKALIKAIRPNYNKELFRNYPVSKDGLYNKNYDMIEYTFMDPISLVYQEGEIEGGLIPMGGDSILITNNKEFKLHKLG